MQDGRHLDAPPATLRPVLLLAAVIFPSAVNALPVAAIALLLASACATVPEAADRRTLNARITATRSAAIAAYGSGHLAAWRAAQTQLAALLPNDPELRFRLAAAEARSGDEAAMCASLAAVALSGARIDADGDPRNATDFAAMRRSPCLLDWLSRNAVNGRPRIASSLLHRHHERDAIPSGLAWDPGRSAHLVTTLRGRRLLKIGTDGRESALSLAAPERDWNLLAVAVDAGRDRLWLSAQARPGFPGIADADAGRASLVAYSLATGQRRISLPFAPLDGRPAALAALALLPDGRLLAADAAQGRIWIIDAERQDWTLLAEGFGTPTDLAVAADGRSVHVADAALGLWQLVPETGAVVRVTAPPSVALTGIAGLVRDGDTLIAVQGGTTPRIVRLALSADGLAITGQSVLEQGAALLGAPGHARLDGTALVYLAHVGRDRLGDDGRMPLRSEAPSPELRRLPLTPASGP